MAFTGPLEDRTAIRELMESYADAVFRHDADAWAACWTDDAVWDLLGTEVRGRATLVPAWKGAMAGFRLAAFFVFPGEIIVDGETATARSHTQEHLLTVDGGVRRIIGRYQDALSKADGRWRFSLRRYTVLNEE